MEACSGGRRQLGGLIDMCVLMGDGAYKGQTKNISLRNLLFFLVFQHPLKFLSTTVFTFTPMAHHTAE